MKRLMTIIGALLLIAMLLYALACNSDKPTEPKPVTDYPVYITDYNWSLLLTYHPISQKLDTALLTLSMSSGVTAAADGKRLYIAGRSEISVIDPETRAVITQLPYRTNWPVVVSPDNRLVAITGDDLYILSTLDYSVVFNDTDISEYGCFSADSRRFYCAAGWSTESTGKVYKVDLSDSLYPVERLEGAGGGVIHVVPTLDEKKLLLYKNGGTWTSAFDVYDVEEDSIIFRHLLSPGSGEVAMTPDGKYAIYTNAGNSGTDPPANGVFYIFDIEANQIHAEVSAYDYVGLPLPALIPPISTAITPDSRWLIMLGGLTLLRNAIFLYDFKNEELVDFIYLNNSALTNPTVQLIK